MSQSPSRETLLMHLRLPHPWYTTYTIKVGAYDDGLRQFQIHPTNPVEKAAHEQLHKDDLFWTEPKADNYNTTTTTEAAAPSSDLWTNQEPAPLSRIFWGKNSSRPSIGQVWLAAYGLVTLYPKTDAFAIQLQGPQSADVANELCRVGLLAKSPAASSPSSSKTSPPPPDYFLFRGSFWQGAGSPFGSRPVWLPPASSAQSGEWEFPPLPLQHAFQTDIIVHRGHAADTIDAALSTPIRAPAPAPGTVVYSRWIPHLRAHLALSVLDADDAAQVALYSRWHRHGTADTHAEYLRALQHHGTGAGAAAIPLLATLDGRPAAYFEPYWVRDRVEDEIGAHFDAGAFDRGCGVLFPPSSSSSSSSSSDLDPRVVAALWGSAVHYLFLDEPRTMRVFGAPAYVDGMAVGFEGRFPFSVARRVESVLAEETLAVCGRELFFQLCPFAGQGAVRVVERERGDGGLWAKL
ncbi:putative aerobactin siderophore biosynthesis protein iucb protein [Lasiodiplodia theobromae]|uniref:Aerobactin siderophore biosynthesis protein iucb protein n=1 Tax=Lasiodiplodia theobromae TaxID=45133 RepID=A0A8H7IRL5_9PEZI|nr:putative aerobactin siderophore biosynthesis protein iucb protein [Lasiodiplodia theobromae]